MLLVAVSVATCGCSAGAKRDASVPTSRVSGTADRSPTAFVGTRPAELRTYLHAWQTSWWRVGRDLERGGDDAPSFSDTPDRSWDRARRDYGEAALAFRRHARRLAAISPPSTMRPANAAYLAAVRRQATRFQSLSDAFAGTDPRAMERALEALESSQMRFDFDGAQWERAVIAACGASGVEVPTIVRRKYVSNGQRTS
jgi:hypothetical protein